MSGIYLHIPFCKQACAYCDFHFSTQQAGKESMVNAIQAEIAQRHAYLAGGPIECIYFGGGTPSLLTVAELGNLFAAIGKVLQMGPEMEITLEVNPDDVNVTALKNWRQLGVNRLSIGLQSFNNVELKWMNRAHTAQESLASVKMAQDAGFDNLTIDLIYGSRFQTRQTWEKTLKTAIGLQTQHISAYNLTIEKKTALGVAFSRGNEPAVNDDLSHAQFMMMRQALTADGFVHYEVSNFGKPGFLARHNTNYWLGKHYLGVGPSAHSFNGASRQWNVSNNAVYVRSVTDGMPFFEMETLSPNQRYNEYVLTRLRTMWGCDVSEIERLFGRDMAQHFKKQVVPSLTFLVEKEGVYTLTSEGLMRADGIAAGLFA